MDFRREARKTLFYDIVYVASSAFRQVDAQFPEKIWREMTTFRLYVIVL